MARLAAPPAAAILLFLVIICSDVHPPVADALPYVQYRIALDLSRSLLKRVADLRVSRGDHSGSARVRSLANGIERGLELGFLGTAWSVGWNFVKNSKWREMDYRELEGVVSDMDELRGIITELTRGKFDTEKVARSYRNALLVLKRLPPRLLKVFPQSEAMSEVMAILQIEMVKGRLFTDCIEVGSDELSGLLKILKDVASAIVL